MKVEMEFQGLQELLKAFEDAASDAEVAEVNRKIVEKGEPVVKKIMSGKIPKSADIKKKWSWFWYEIIGVYTCCR